jgi:hypothetical protein
MPLAGVYGGTLLDFTQTSDQNVGSLYTGGNKLPDFKSLVYLNGTASGGSPPPTLMLVDQVGYYPLNQSASLQTFTNVTPPNRYNTNGAGGLQMSLIATALGGATASNITSLAYVDDQGNSMNMPVSTTITVATGAVAPTATLGARVLTSINGPFLPLAAGDAGVQQCTNITFSAANTGLEALVLVRPLMTFPINTVLAYNERDFATNISSLERVYDGACLTWMAFFPTATGCNLMGNLDVGWG